MAALQRSREAISELQGQLDTLLVSLRSPDGVLDPDAPQRLASARAEASQAMASLQDTGQLFG